MVWGGWADPQAKAWGSALLVSCFVRWVSIWSPQETGIGVALRTRHMGVLKFLGDRTRGLSAQRVTSDLATCGPVQDVLAQGILDKINHRGSLIGS